MFAANETEGAVPLGACPSIIMLLEFPSFEAASGGEDAAAAAGGCRGSFHAVVEEGSFAAAAATAAPLLSVFLPFSDTIGASTPLV